MQLNNREREILTLAASGKTSKEIADAMGMAKITVDMHVGTILNKMGALNRNQAIAKAISHKLIRVIDSGHAEYKSAKMHAVRVAPRVHGRLITQPTGWRKDWATPCGGIGPLDQRRSALLNSHKLSYYRHCS